MLLLLTDEYTSELGVWRQVVLDQASVRKFHIAASDSNVGASVTAMRINEALRVQAPIRIR